MRSGSYRVKEWLLSKQQGYVLTAPELFAEFAYHPDGPISKGSVSGFLSALVEHGILRIQGNKRPHPYVLADKKALEAFRVRETSRDVSTGHTRNGPRGKDKQGAPSIASLADRLMAIAADLEKLEPDLRLVSTDDILAELVRRQKEHNK